MTTIDTATIDEAKILELAQELIRQYPPSTTSVIDFLGAQFDMGLAWVHFPVGHGAAIKFCDGLSGKVSFSLVWYRRPSIWVMLRLVLALLPL